MERYLVIHERTCPECDGEGVYYNPLWINANAAYDQARARTEEELSILDAVGQELGVVKDEDAYYDAVGKAADAGYSAMGAYFDAAGYGRDGCHWPPEELPCGECDGKGIIREEVDLADALTALQEAADA